jgi:hypothetical protein
VASCAAPPLNSSGYATPVTQQPAVMTFRALLACSLLLSSACARTTEDLNLPPALTEYRSWESILLKPRPVPHDLWIRCVGRTPEQDRIDRETYGPHTHFFVNVYVNDAASAAKRDGSRLPVGTIIAKEKFTDSNGGRPVGVAFMIKRDEDSFPETHGWEFLYFPSSEDSVRSTHESCASCHRQGAATDYVLGNYWGQSDTGS